MGGLHDISYVEDTGEFFEETVRLIEKKNNIQAEIISGGWILFLFRVFGTKEDNHLV